MKAKELFSVLDHPNLVGPDDVQIDALGYDSRSLQRNHCFIAIPGTLRDGHDFIPAAIAAGASAIVCEKLPMQRIPGVCFCQVKDSAGAAASLFNKWYDYPSGKLQLVGVTGTNGKTTTDSLLFDLFSAMGYLCGLISTVIYKIGNDTCPFATFRTKEYAASFTASS
jgi:UDP-N-acetylmuramoyl-L-alanyl-D-glutamate--2,6-diaminopimelate ligase